MLPDRSRRRLYLVSIALGLPGLILAWWLQWETNPFVALAYPLLAVHLAACAALLWRRSVRLPPLERITFVLIAAIGIGLFAYGLASASPGAASWETVQRPPNLLLSLLVLFGYVALPIRTALLAAAAVVAATTVLGLVAFVPAAVYGEVRPLLDFAHFQIYLLMGAAFVHALAHGRAVVVRAARDAERSTRYARRDRLTALPNRRALEEELERRIAESERYGRPLAVLVIDLDHFKRVNHEYGHRVGDALLRAVGSNLAPYLRAGDTLGRWGGQEFLVIAPSTNLTAARELALRCATKLAATRFEPGIRTTASLGVTAREPGDSVASMLRRAEALMARAKSEGRNRVCAGSSASLP